MCTSARCLSASNDGLNCCSVALNKPDLSLFVGEALVGNDSVDQLKKFNQALRDHALNEIGRNVSGGRKQYDILCLLVLRHTLVIIFTGAIVQRQVH